MCIFIPWAVAYRFVRGQASVQSYVSNDFVMIKLVKGDILEFIRVGGKKKWVALCESHQYWFEVVAMYDTRMPRVNVMK